MTKEKEKRLAEYEKVQNLVLKRLFDEAKPVTREDLAKIINKPASETQYHFEVLLERKLITNTSEMRQQTSFPCFMITSAGRKKVMEELGMEA